MSQNLSKVGHYFLRKADKTLYRITSTHYAHGKMRYNMAKVGWGNHARYEINENTLLNCYIKLDKKTAEILYGGQNGKESKIPEGS